MVWGAKPVRLSNVIILTMEDFKLPEKLEFEFQEKADPQVLTLLDKLGKAIVVVFNQLKNYKVELPKTFQVKGDVNVTDIPPIHIENFKDLRSYFEMSEKAIKQLATAITLVSSKSPVPQKSINFDTKPLLNALQELKESIKPTNNEEVVNALHTVSEQVGALVEKPSFIPPAVTNININSLRGIAKTTSVTVGATAVKLPTTPIDNRRALVIYNLGASTLYIGGSNVTTANGFPIIANSFSPTMDAGILMTIYGISSGSLDVRVMEISNDTDGS